MPRRIAMAAVVIATLTVVARLAGFVRTLVFARTVGATDLGDMYQTANTIPNIIFEIAAGGALSVVVVPLLAGAVAAGDRDRVGQTSSALLTWTVCLLIPLAVLLALLAQPVVALLANGAGARAVQVGADMLRVFAIQLPLYGTGIVLTGVLHAHHRFVWPVLAPLLSSVTVIVAYLVFAAVDGAGVSLAQVSTAGELVLSVGTTLGVAVLALCLVVPVRRLRLGLRPSLRMGGKIRAAAVSLAGAAVVTVVAQQVVTAYLIRLANGGDVGTVVLYTLAQTVFLVAWAVLAVPLSTPTFPALARAAAAGDHAGFDRRLAGTARVVLVAAGLGVAGLVAVAAPAGRLLSAITSSHPSAPLLGASIVAFAPGLVGYSLFALLNRALNAAGQARSAARSAVAGWAAVAVAALVLANLTTPANRVLALAAASSVGMSVLGAALVWVIARRRSPAALAGFARTLLVSLAAAVLAGSVGWLVGRAVMALAPGVSGAAVAGMLAGAVGVAGYAAAVLAADPGDLRPVLASAVARIRARGLRDGR